MEGGGDVSPFTLIDGGGELEGLLDVRCRSLRIVRSALLSRAGLAEAGGWLEGPVSSGAPSSASSLISFNRLEDTAGDEV